MARDYIRIAMMARELADMKVAVEEYKDSKSGWYLDLVADYERRVKEIIEVWQEGK